LEGRWLSNSKITIPLTHVSLENLHQLQFLESVDKSVNSTSKEGHLSSRNQA
jgi:hypothetical protein